MAALPEYVIKGASVRVFENQQINALSDKVVDCRGANAVHVEVFVNGATPSATLTLKGASEPGGNYLTLPAPNATQTSVSANDAYDCLVGAPYVKMDLSAISGTFGSGLGYTVIITPYVAPGLNTQAIEGDVAAGEADSGNPVKTGGKASSALPTAVDNGDRVNAYYDLYGRQIVVTVNGPDTVYSATALTGALSLSTALTTRFKFKQATIHLNTAPTSAGSITLTLDALDGPAYDTLLRSVDPSDGRTDVVFEPASDVIYEAGDKLTLAYANPDNRTFGVRLVVEGV